MVKVTAQMVNELRQKTGVGMMECKKALVESNGDVSVAIEHLRKAGIAKAAKKAGRSATQGKFIVCSNDEATVLVEVLCETDFVAKTGEFTSFAEEAAAKALNDFDCDGDISEQLAALVSDDLKALIGKLGENMQLRRALRWENKGGLIGTYLHTGVPYGVMVQVGGECSDELLNNICLHVCASNPSYISAADVPAEFIEKEKEIAAAQPELQGKPAQIMEGILKGKMNKIYKEICLMEQPWIDDDKSSLSKVAPQVKVLRFVRWLVGEGEADEASAEE